MGIQVRCPLCGLTRPPSQFGQYDLAAKEVRSLGGDRGFEHTEVPMPPDLARQIEDAIERLYHHHVEVAHLEREAAATVHEPDPDPEPVEPREIAAEVDAAIEHELHQANVETEIDRAIRRTMIEGEIERVIETEIERITGRRL